jgi:hypothetical protein
VVAFLQEGRTDLPPVVIAAVAPDDARVDLLFPGYGREVDGDGDARLHRLIRAKSDPAEAEILDHAHVVVVLVTAKVEGDVDGVTVECTTAAAALVGRLAGLAGFHDELLLMHAALFIIG